MFNIHNIVSLIILYCTETYSLPSCMQYDVNNSTKCRSYDGNDSNIHWPFSTAVVAIKSVQLISWIYWLQRNINARQTMWGKSSGYKKSASFTMQLAHLKSILNLYFLKWHSCIALSIVELIISFTPLSLSFNKKIGIYMYIIPVRRAIIICHCVELTWGSVVRDMLVILCGTTFLTLILIQTSASLFSLEVLKQQYVKTYFNLSYVPHDIVLLMYNYW